MRVGRPPFQITDEVKSKVESLAAQGLTQEQICSVLGISRQTMCKKKRMFADFNDALKRGKNKGLATITNSLFNKAKTGDTASTIFYLKNRDRENWQERPDKQSEFNYDENVPLNIQANNILKAASEGEISHDSAQSLIGSLSNIASLQEFSEMQKDINELKRLLNELCSHKERD